MDETGAAAVDDVRAGGDEGGGVPYADVGGFFLLRKLLFR